ncbi:MAG: DUF3179 domain-containing protein, partial [Candidatus Uhrbacteria bacterium]|nr:DUF3179 domain-containing protein [Candidatus Uhrbacteria bacterium]
QKQSVFITAVIAVAVLFWGYDAWKQYRLTNQGWPELDGGLYAEAMVVDDVSYLIPGDQAYETGVAKDGIPAINDPKYISVNAADNVIADDLYGIDVEVNGEHRYYPYQIMNWHEVVNDTFGDKDLLVTYCTLCGVPKVYERQLDGVTQEFGVSGKVYNNNTLLYDKATDSLWLQATGQAVVGSSVGKSLSVYPSAMPMRWGDWKAAYPNGDVLSTETGFVRDYTRHPYGSYEKSPAIYFPMNFVGTSFGNKWIVSLVDVADDSAAFAWNVLMGIGIQEDEIGGTPAVAVYDHELDVARVFDRRVGDKTLTFTFDFDAKELRDTETGSRWNVEGLAISGEMKGERMSEVLSSVMYSVCAQSLFPEMRPVGGEVASDDEEVDPIEIDVSDSNVST